MTKGTRVGFDSFDTRKSPLIPALVFMTMTSFTPVNNNVSFLGSPMGICRGATGTNANGESLSLYIQQEMKKHVKKQVREGKLAESKGVSLPPSVNLLPDETLDFLSSQEIIPSFINRSQEGSLIIEFTADGKYHLIEFYTDGDIVLLVKGEEGTDAWDLTSENYFDKLRETLLVEPESVE